MTTMTANGLSTPSVPAPVPPRKARVVRVPVYPNSRQALAMLTLMPVFATPVPRLHVEPKAPDGRLMVYDRASREYFVVYTPRFRTQFREGHRAGQWYVRLASDFAAPLCSLGFATAVAAIEALKAGRWRLLNAPRRRTAERLRVIWSAASPGTDC